LAQRRKKLAKSLRPTVGELCRESEPGASGSATPRLSREADETVPVEPLGPGESSDNEAVGSNHDRRHPVRTNGDGSTDDRQHRTEGVTRD
jgi:hypothetical protein